MKNRVIIICGPTASGKTDIAVKVALKLNGEIISADSMQLYKGMDVGTAKPTKEEMQGIPHHMLDFLSPTELFNAADYKEAAYKLCFDILGRGKTPIIAGGTGQYISAVFENLTYGDIPEDKNLRDELTALALEKGGEYMKKLLSEFDKESAQKLHENDIRRLVRAIEVYKLTGVTQSEFNRRSKEIEPPFEFLLFGLKFENRELLYERINKRVDVMLQNGLEEEAKKLYSSPVGKTAAQAIGYKELLEYFNGNESLAEAADKIRQESRRYAKRQLTWFNHMPVKWFYPDLSSPDEIASEIAETAKGEKPYA